MFDIQNGAPQRACFWERAITAFASVGRAVASDQRGPPRVRTALALTQPPRARAVFFCDRGAAGPKLRRSAERKKKPDIRAGLWFCMGGAFPPICAIPDPFVSRLGRGTAPVLSKLGLFVWVLRTEGPSAKKSPALPPGSVQRKKLTADHKIAGVRIAG